MCIRNKVVASAAVLVFIVQICSTQLDTRGPPKVDKPILLDSYIPASMQVIVHLTELMKYEVSPTTKPPYAVGTTTTSTMRPTPTHRPGIYAPFKPPGSQVFHEKEFNYRDYVESLQQPSGLNYFGRYPLTDGKSPPSDVARDSVSRNSKFADEDPIEYELYFGKRFADVVDLARRVELDTVVNDIDRQVDQFSKEYDDTHFRFEQFRKKRVPPTKAYVTLLSLYDMLNKEAKKLGLNKFQGYTDRMLQELATSSVGTSAYQLKIILSKVVERGDTRKPEIVKKINTLLADLNEPHSYIIEALKDIPPLPFAL